MSGGLFTKAGTDDEMRDARGRWARTIGAVAKPFGTGGTVGLSRSQIASKVRDTLDDLMSHPPGLKGRPATYTASLATKVASTVLGLPNDVQAHAEHHVAAATGLVAHKVMSHPGWRRLATKVVTRLRMLRKSLDDDEADDLKGIVANVMADTRFEPRVSCDDGAFAEVARGAYRHCHDRLCALGQA